MKKILIVFSKDKSTEKTEAIRTAGSKAELATLVALLISEEKSPLVKP